MNTCSRRILREARHLLDRPPPGIRALQEEGDGLQFKATITGPTGTPYEGGLFKLDVVLPAEYPMRPPKVNFTTKLFHPNVDKEGRICMDTLIKDAWSPAYTIELVLLSIQSLLAQPNLDEPLDVDEGQLWKTNEAEARKRAKEWALQYAREEA